MTVLPVAANCPTPYHRRPERTLLYRTVQAHFATWLALTRDGEGDADATRATSRAPLAGDGFDFGGELYMPTYRRLQERLSR